MPRTVVKLCRNGGKDSVTKTGRCLKVQVRVRSGTMTVWESEMQGAFLVEPDSCFNTIHNHHGCIIPTIYITSRHLKPTQSGRQLYYDILYITGYPVWGGDFTCVTWQLGVLSLRKEWWWHMKRLIREGKWEGWESSGIQHLSYDNRTTISLTIPFIAEMWFIDFYSLKGKHKN